MRGSSTAIVKSESTPSATKPRMVPSCLKSGWQHEPTKARNRMAMDRREQKVQRQGPALRIGANSPAITQHASSATLRRTHPSQAANAGGSKILIGDGAKGTDPWKESNWKQSYVTRAALRRRRQRRKRRW